jgi:hypothetical protein
MISGVETAVAVAAGCSRMIDGTGVWDGFGVGNRVAEAAEAV